MNANSILVNARRKKVTINWQSNSGKHPWTQTPKSILNGRILREMLYVSFFVSIKKARVLKYYSSLTFISRIANNI